MTQDQNRRLAQQLLAGRGDGADADEIAELFSADVLFEIQGDVGALPWIGRRTGRGAVADFVRGTRSLVKQHRFEVQDILASDDRAVIVGELASTIEATGKVVELAFALILTVQGGQITRFQMLEDSFAVSRAARP